MFRASRPAGARLPPRCLVDMWPPFYACTGIMFSSTNFLGMTNLMSVMPLVGECDHDGARLLCVRHQQRDQGCFPTMHRHIPDDALWPQQPHTLVVRPLLP